jgi:hypothetical protein
MKEHKGRCAREVSGGLTEITHDRNACAKPACPIPHNERALVDALTRYLSDAGHGGDATGSYNLPIRLIKYIASQDHEAGRSRDGRCEPAPCAILSQRLCRGFSAPVLGTLTTITMSAAETCAEEVSIMRIKHWQDSASLLLGVWLILSPFVLGFAAATTWITVVLGLLVIMFAVEGFIVPSYLEEWGEILLGLALLLAPWTIGYESGSATVSSVTSGPLVILFAVWELATDREFITRWRDHWHHPAT